MSTKHSAIVRQVGARVGREDEPVVAVFQASCVCGWSADQTYTRYQRACRAYQRHANGGR
jgi:hypothetical protein